MPSPEAESMIAMYAEYRLPASAPSRSYAELRAMSEQLGAAQPAVEGCTVEGAALGGITTERTRADGEQGDRVIVYIHGGGYVCGSAGGQRAFLGALARAGRAEIHSVEYRLAPEHPHPAAVEDVVAAYAGALEVAEGRPVVVGGDSAGGGLALAAVLAIRDRGLDLPAAMFALSPWTDMTLRSGTFDDLADRDLMVRKADLQMMRDCYLGERDASTPLASPVFGDLSGLPPLLVQVGSEEVLLGDAQRIVAAAQDAGVQAEIEVADGMFHTWQVIAPGLPESQRAIQSLGRFVTR